MDEFARGTVEYDQAHGLYERGGRYRIVSPGEQTPSHRWRRVRSVAHPGVTREFARRAPHVLDRPLLAVRALGGLGQGVDISEHQGSTPGGFDFYVVRYINEYGRTDSRVGQHVGTAHAWGRPLGSYGIIQPGAIDPVLWAQRYVNLLREMPTDFVPVVDIELGDPGANRGYAAVVNDVLRRSGYGVLMAYYSAGSAYRQQCQGLYDRHFLAAWGSRYPSGAHMHQWQGSPLDRDYCPDYAPISGGGAPPPPPPPPPKLYGRTDDMFPRNPKTGTIWLLTGGVLNPLSGPDWALLLWEHAVQNGGQGPKPVDMDNDLRIVQLGRLYGVSDADIQAATGIDLGADDPVLASRLTASGPPTEHEMPEPVDLVPALV